MDVLRDPNGQSVIQRLAPSIEASNLLHTYYGQPVGLVLATEDGLSDAVRDAIIAELEALEISDPPASEAPLVTSASRAYESDDVVVGSATLTAPVSGRVWERLEFRFDGPFHGNPYIDVELTARFFGPNGEVLDALGFYAGDGEYRVRFLPPSSGDWRVEFSSNARSLDGLTADVAVEQGPGHGPVRVADRFHFAYADGERYVPIGTTCYAWTHQGDELEERTLESLASSPFNKIRMCVFPKSYTFNTNEPQRYPFARTADGWDGTRFDPEYWDHLERRIDQLDRLGIQADLILFHPYDRWGFATMDAATDDRYLRYAVARLSSFTNVWWSLANEFDLMFAKSESDWERWAGIIQRWDPTDHLRSIHNCRVVYDHSRPWITHVSMQRTDHYKTSEMTGEWLATWGKPVVVDECAYEGDIDQGWGNITGEEMTRRFWEGALRGGYVGHGETYLDPDDVLWWAKGGELHGTSPDRIAFLARILSETPSGVFEPLELEWDSLAAGVVGEQYLFYYGFDRPAFRRFLIDPSFEWDVDVIDTWNMTITELPEPVSGRFVVQLPAQPYMAVRLRRRIG